MPSGSTLELYERQKRSHTKARSGCSTCKKRRIKCGEEKPVCARCQLGRRQCTYSTPKTWIFEPQKSSEDLPLVLHLPPSTSPGSLEEQRAFQFFREKTALQFAGHNELHQRFFSIFIPQSAVSNPIIFKLVVSMGARHEANSDGSTKADELASSTHALVISSMARNLAQMRTDITLLSCAMLMGYANLCKEVPATAAIHFSLGLKMLREATCSGQELASDEMSSFIGPMFAELEIATAVFAIPPPGVEIIPQKPRFAPRLPSTLVDLYQAKSCLFDIIGWYVYSTATYQISMFDLAARAAEVDELLIVWRRLLVDYSLRIAAVYPELYMLARKMLFQYKLFHMCKSAARNTMFINSCQVEMVSIDFTRPQVISIIYLVKANADKGSWPLRVQPSRNGDNDLDIWPTGDLVGADGPRSAVRIVLGG